MPTGGKGLPRVEIKGETKKVLLVMSVAMHRDVRARAKAEGVTASEWIRAAVASRLTQS